MDKPQIIEHVNKSVNYTIFAAHWVPSSARIVALGSHARGTGAFQIYNLEGPDLKLVTDVCSYRRCCNYFISRSCKNRLHSSVEPLLGHLWHQDI